MLIGLLSKTAILLTEYASTRRRQGMVIGTIALLFIVPVLYDLLRRDKKRVKKKG